MPFHKVTGSPVQDENNNSLRKLQEVQENPKGFLLKQPTCLNNSSHKPYWNNHWRRSFLPDHVHEVNLEIAQAYCKECHETISYWPEFVLPYQREALETHEFVLIEHLQRMSFREIGAKIGYNPRTISRRVNLVLEQGVQLWGEVIGSILSVIGQPKVREEQGSLKAFPSVALEEAIKLRLAQPVLSADSLIDILCSQNIPGAERMCVSTLNRHF